MYALSYTSAFMGFGMDVSAISEDMWFLLRSFPYMLFWLTRSQLATSSLHMTQRRLRCFVNKIV